MVYNGKDGLWKDMAAMDNRLVCDNSLILHSDKWNFSKEFKGLKAGRSFIPLFVIEMEAFIWLMGRVVIGGLFNRVKVAKGWKTFNFIFVNGAPLFLFFDASKDLRTYLLWILMLPKISEHIFCGF